MRKSRLRLETTATVREAGSNRTVVIHYAPNAGDILVLRAKGMRTSYPVSIEDVYHLAVRREVERVRRERKAAK